MMSTTCGCSLVQWGIVIVLLSVATGPGYAMPRTGLPTQLLFSELLGAGGNEDNTYYGEQLKYQQQQQRQQQEQKQQRLPSFARKWPSLRDLLLTADYEDLGVPQDSNERELVTSSRLISRLHKLSENGGGGEELRYNLVNDLTDMPAKKVVPSASLKEHNTKKNVQYMSPCHFKICNMGRKRNAGSYVPY
ncbi:uncharacterized protein DMAD_06646 [Drosophila madeirensis]|uniref:CNMamide n=1 Tax=Drosophila madeirensis TaxID=30013 RepID=A0AAU9FS39_DROMD